jgi:hypothetical protein
MTRRLLAFTLLAALGAALNAHPAHAQRERDRDRDEERDELESRIDTTVALDRNGTVELALASGSITVTGWDRREARVRATSERGEIHLERAGSRLEVGVRSRHGRAGETTFEVSVPVGTRVLVRSTSGDLTVTGVRGEVEANTMSGDIEIGDAERVTIGAVNGSAIVRRVSGDLTASLVNGDVEVEGASGDLEVTTVSGEIVLRDIRTKYARARTTSGDVEFDGTIDPSGRYDFGSHSGSVVLAIPGGTDATLSVQTFSGEVESDFAIRLEPGDHRMGGHPRRFEFTLGDGGARIAAETFSGDIHLVERGGARRDR